MSYFHSQKKQRGVDSMLLRLYNPILWRALSVRLACLFCTCCAESVQPHPLQSPHYKAGFSYLIMC